VVAMAVDECGSTMGDEDRDYNLLVKTTLAMLPRWFGKP